MLFQPTNITPDELNNTGTVDVTAGMTVSWRVSGDSAMTAYKIDIMLNNVASTAVYSTGKVSLGTPFWGTDYTGAVQYYSVTISSATLTGAGMSNGLEYKMLITQWWSANDSVQQMTASIFNTRKAPSLAITAISNPVTSKEYSFTATYSQAQNDPIKWVRWQIAYDDDHDNPFVDTGNIYGTGQLQIDYDGFLTGTSYAVKCTVESSSGVSVTTGWETFSVSYSLPTASGTAQACQLKDKNCVWVDWDRIITADGYSVMRQTVGENRLVKIADLPSTTTQIRDYSTRSGYSYIYYVFPTGSLSYLTQPMVTDPVSVKFWFWAIIEAQNTGKKNEYSAMAAYIFKYGAGGVSVGSYSNNNSPQISQNFTKYPTRQGTTANYLTGTVGGYIGTVSDFKEYSDTVSQSEAIFRLSNSENALFLVDPKGRFLRIHTAAAITMDIDFKKRPMPQTMNLSWVEVGSTDGVNIIMYPSGEYYPVDRIILTTLDLDPLTGTLTWTVPDDYEGTGSELSINSDGTLMQDDNGSFLPATMAMDSTTKIVTADVE